MHRRGVRPEVRHAFVGDAAAEFQVETLQSGEGRQQPEAAVGHVLAEREVQVAQRCEAGDMEQALVGELHGQDGQCYRPCNPRWGHPSLSGCPIVALCVMIQSSPRILFLND